MFQQFGPYQVGETIGRGTFGKVKVAIHETSRRKVALKIISRRVMEQSERSILKITREIQIQQLLRHLNITQLYDVVQTKHDIVLVLEYVAGGDLFDYICRRNRLTEAVAQPLYQQIAAAVAYLHKYRVVHRDIKPENIMMDQEAKTIKIADFGLSCITQEGCFLKTSCGTPNYASPEIVSGELYSGPESDVWSCGVVLYTMLTGCLPFNDSKSGNLLKKIQKGDYRMPNSISAQAQDLLRRMLVVNPLHRATMEQVMQHPWVRPSFPPYLLALHYEATLDTMRFGVSNLLRKKLDGSIVDIVATRFNRTSHEVASIVEAKEMGNLPFFLTLSNELGKKRERYPAEEFFRKRSNIIDVMLWPKPLFIPAAENALRDENHDICVTYLILLHHKQTLSSLEELTKKGGRSSTAGSLVISHSANQGYGSLNACSLQQFSLNVTSLSKSCHDTQQLNTMVSHVNKNSDIAFGGSFSASVQLAPLNESITDPYIDGYNRIIEVFLPLRYTHTSSTLLGGLLGVPERSAAQMLSQPVTRPFVLDTNNINKSGDGNLLHPLLKPMAEGTVDVSVLAGNCILLRHSFPSVNEKECMKVVRFDGTDTPSDVKNKPQLSSPVPHVIRCEEMTRFGNGFLHDGVLFFNSSAITTLNYVYDAMREEGLLWKSVRPYFLVAVKHPCVKLQVAIFKFFSDSHLVNLRVSCQSGMQACVEAIKLIERLRKRAVKHIEKHSERGLAMDVGGLASGDGCSGSPASMAGCTTTS